MLKRIITLITFTLGVGSQGWAEDLSELEHRVASYIDSALKEGKKHQECKQRTTAIAAWVESNPLKLKRIAQRHDVLQKIQTIFRNFVCLDMRRMMKRKSRRKKRKRSRRTQQRKRYAVFNTYSHT